MEPSNLLSRDGHSNLPVIHVGKVSLKKGRDLEHKARGELAGIACWTLSHQKAPAASCQGAGRQCSAFHGLAWGPAGSSRPSPGEAGGGRTSDLQEAVEGALGPTERKPRGRAEMLSAGPCPTTLCPPSPGGSNGAPKAKGLPLDQRLPADGLGTWLTHTQHPQPCSLAFVIPGALAL